MQTPVKDELELVLGSGASGLEKLCFFDGAIAVARLFANAIAEPTEASAVAKIDVIVAELHKHTQHTHTLPEPARLVQIGTIIRDQAAALPSKKKAPKLHLIHKRKTR